METSLFIAICAGLGGMLGWGLADFFAKKTIDEVGDVITLAWAHIFGTAIILIAFLYQILFQHGYSHVEFDIQTWLLLLFFGILQAIIYLLVYRGFSKGQVAVLSPIFASFTGITAAFSIIVLGEIITGYFFLGLATLFIGILLVNFDPHAFKKRRINFVRVPGFGEVAGATLLAVIWTLLWDKFIGGQDWLVYASAMYILMTLAILVVVYYLKLRLFNIKNTIWKFLILIGLCEIVAYIAISWGYSTTSLTSVVALLSGAFSLPTIFLARVFLEEKIYGLQIIGGLVIIIGIMILSVL